MYNDSKTAIIIMIITTIIIATTYNTVLPRLFKYPHLPKKKKNALSKIPPQQNL